MISDAILFASVAVEARLRLSEVCAYVCVCVRRGQTMSGFHGFFLCIFVCVCVCMCAHSGQ